MEYASAMIGLFLTAIAIFVSYKGNELHGPRKMKAEKIKLYEEYYKAETAKDQMVKSISKKLVEDIFFTITKRQEKYSLISLILKLDCKDELLSCLDKNYKIYKHNNCDASGQSLYIDYKSEEKAYFLVVISALFIYLSIALLTINTLLLIDDNPFSADSYIYKEYDRLDDKLAAYYMTISIPTLVLTLAKSLLSIFSAKHTIDIFRTLRKSNVYNHPSKIYTKFAKGAINIIIAYPKTAIFISIATFTYCISEKPYVENTCEQLLNTTSLVSSIITQSTIN